MSFRILLRYTIALVILFPLLTRNTHAQSGNITIERTSERLNVMEVRTAYSHDLELIKHAYRMAFVEMKLSNISETYDKIEAEARSGNLRKMTAYFWNSDTLNVDVGVAAHYVFSPDSTAYYPGRLRVRAEKHLSTDAATIHRYRFAIYPEGLAKCPEVAFPDSTDEVKYPELKGGRSRLASRIKYPDKAKAEGVEGRVLLMFNVDETGRASCVETQIGFPYGINEAAIEAMKKAKFKPGTINGKPAPMRMGLTLTFDLKDKVRIYY